MLVLHMLGKCPATELRSQPRVLKRWKSKRDFEKASICVCVCEGELGICRGQRSTLGTIPQEFTSFVEVGCLTVIGAYQLS